SVGRIAPPPSRTTTVHTPQLPLPPQADGMKILLAERVLSRVVPPFVRSTLFESSLMVIATSPLGTSLAFAASITATCARIITVKPATPRRMVSIYLLP